ncbi:MAG TPA: IS66 family transposase [Pyrinomonadaceae bacterium]|nr:IS66 family transposase [Pyrinomonadaceae bacterium]
MAKEEETPRTNPAEIENLIEQIRGTNLDPRAKEKVERLLRTVLSLVELLQRKNTSIKKLREMIFGKRTERHQARKTEGREKVDESEKSDDGQPKAVGDQDARAELRAIGSEDKPKRKGHGRRAASDYSGAKIVRCRHEGLKAGDDCPASCGGRLYDLKEPTALMQFTGQPLITATKFEREALRCAKCQQRYVAPLPDGVNEERYDATCDATIALMRYGGGLPWHRQAGLQAMGGMPLGEATMWERCEATADAAIGIFLRLTRLAAGGEVMHTDDTRVRILSCLKEDKEEKGRATQTSGIVVKAGGRKIALYLSGRRHAGENLAKLLEKREEGLARPIQMSDALAANTSVEKNVIRAYCLAHARRKVFELKDDYPAECAVVLDAVGKVYGYEAETAEMSGARRLAYHQEKSGPVMEELKRWIETQFSDRKVEPNSNLGKALQYWLSHWEELTVWLREPGAPVDNNESERALKQFILMRKNSMFFKTEHGAAVGDVLASLIRTCRLNGVNAWHYLVTIIRHRKDARSNPDLYLPWNYKRDEAELLAA